MINATYKYIIIIIMMIIIMYTYATVNFRLMRSKIQRGKIWLMTSSGGEQLKTWRVDPSVVANLFPFSGIDLFLGKLGMDSLESMSHFFCFVWLVGGGASQKVVR